MTNHLQIHNWSTLHKCYSYEQLNYWISAFDSLCQPAKFFYICLSMHTLYLSGCALRFVTREGYPRGEVDRQGSQSSLFLIYIILFSLSSILLFYDSPFSFFSPCTSARPEPCWITYIYTPSVPKCMSF